MEVIDLPQEIVNYIIYNFVEVGDIHSCMLTCKKFNNLENYQVYNLMISSGRGWKYCIEKGLMESAKMIYRLANELDKKNKIDIHFENEVLFRTSCRISRFTICKGLYDFSVELGNPINIRAISDSAFLTSCQYGHLETAKWLYNLSFELARKDPSFGKPIDINRHYSNLYKWCSVKNYSEMCRWLEELKQKTSSIDIEPNRRPQIESSVNNNSQFSIVKCD